MIQETYPITVVEQTVSNEITLLSGIENGCLMASADSVRYLVLHCSATRCNSDYPPEQMFRDHKARGFHTIGYHFYVRRDGTLTQHRKLLEVGAHCRPYNRCSIGICYEGGLDEQGRPANTLTAPQFHTLSNLFKRLLQLFPDAMLMGHRDMRGASPKDCPCLDVREVFGEVGRF